MVERRPFRLDEIVHLLWSRKLLISTAGVVGAVVFFVASYGVSPLYRSDAAVVVRAEGSVVPDPERAFNSAAINEAVVTTEKEVLSAKGMLSRVATAVAFPPQLNLQGGTLGWIAVFLRGVLPPALRNSLHLDPLLDAMSEPESDRAIAASRLRVIERAIGLSSNKGSSVINVSATTLDPQFSADIVNAITHTYMEDRLAAQSSVARNAESALRERLAQTQSEISAAEGRVATLLQEPGLLEESEVPSALRDLSLLGSRLAAARADLATRRSAYDEALRAQDAAGGDPIRMVELLDQGAVATGDLRRQYLERTQELAQLLVRYGADQPYVVAVQKQIQRMRADFEAEGLRIINQRKAELQSALQTTDALSQQYIELQQSTSHRSAAALVLARDREELASLRSVANTINDRIIALAAQPVDPNARIITVGQVPLRPSFPNKTLFALCGALLAAGSTIMLMLWRFHVQRSQPSPYDQALYLTGPFLGSLPRLNSGFLDQTYLLDGWRGDAAGSWAATFQGLALQLEVVLERQRIKVLTITSGRPGEGKTTVASILAVTLASFGKRILLVNCDLHTSQAGPLKRGSTRVEGDAHDPLASITVSAATGVHMLEFTDMTAEPPLYYLRSDKFREILELTRGRYDLILCDTPPVLAVPDPLLVARHSDAVLLVAEHGRFSDRGEAEEITRRIGLGNKPICGIIVTKTSEPGASFTAYTGYLTA